MGLVYANIELQNGGDVEDFRRHRIGEDEIRQLTVQAMADTGSVMLCINEEIQAALGLEVIDHRPSRLADNTRLKLPVVGAIVVRFAGRICTTNALVLPGDSDVLLGAIPMEELDLYVHPGRQELMPVDPEGPVMMLK